MPSSVIHHYKYDPENKRLRIYFVSGIAYDYEGVTKDLYEKFRQAISKGKFLNTEIKGKFPAVKIN